MNNPLNISTILQKLRTEPGNVLGGLFLAWCLVLPWSIAAMQIGLGLLVVGSVLYALYQKRSPVYFHGIYIFIGLYLIMNLITVLLSPVRQKSLLGILNTEWILLTVPFVISLPLTREWRRYALRVLLLSSTTAGIYGIAQFFSGWDPVRHKMLGQFGNFYRAVGGYGSILSYAGNQLMVFGLALAFFITSGPRRRQRLFYAVITIVLFLSILASQTRSAALAAFVLLVIGILINRKRKYSYILGIILLCFLISIVFLPGLTQRFMNVLNPSENYTRLYLWKSSLGLIADHPWFGIGHGMFNDYLEIYKVPGFYGAGRHAHNDFLNIAVVNGLLGFITWLTIWGAWFFYILRRYKRLPPGDSQRRILLGAGLAITGILAAGQFQCYYTDLENNLLWWFMAMVALQIDLAEHRREQGRAVRITA